MGQGPFFPPYVFKIHFQYFPGIELIFTLFFRKCSGSWIGVSQHQGLVW